MRGRIPGSGDLRVVLVQLLKVLERIPHPGRLLLGRRRGLRNVDGHNGRLPTEQPGFSTMLFAWLRNIVEEKSQNLSDMIVLPKSKNMR